MAAHRVNRDQADAFSYAMRGMTRASKIDRIIELNDRMKGGHICLSCAGPCNCFKGVDRSVRKPVINLVELEPGVWGTPKLIVGYDWGSTGGHPWHRTE